MLSLNLDESRIRPLPWSDCRRASGLYETRINLHWRCIGSEEGLIVVGELATTLRSSMIPFSPTMFATAFGRVSTYLQMMGFEFVSVAARATGLFM
jgi:hypothetical protein